MISPTADPNGLTKYADLAVPIVAIGGAAWTSGQLVDTSPAYVYEGPEHNIVNRNAPPRTTVVSKVLAAPPAAGPMPIGLDPRLAPQSPCAREDRVTQFAQESGARIVVLSVPPNAPSTDESILAFAQESGKYMGLTFVPERRIALPACTNDAGLVTPWTDAGWALFDAGVAWAFPPRYRVTKDPTPSLSPKANVMLPSKDPALAFVVVRASSLDLTYRAAPATAPAAGQILVGDAMGGYLRSAKAVTPGPAWTYHVETGPASLFDLVSDGQIDLSPSRAH